MSHFPVWFENKIINQHLSLLGNIEQLLNTMAGFIEANFTADVANVFPQPE